MRSVTMRWPADKVIRLIPIAQSSSRRLVSVGAAIILITAAIAYVARSYIGFVPNISSVFPEFVASSIERDVSILAEKFGSVDSEYFARSWPYVILCGWILAIVVSVDSILAYVRGNIEIDRSGTFRILAMVVVFIALYLMFFIGGGYISKTRSIFSYHPVLLFAIFFSAASIIPSLVVNLLAVLIFRLLGRRSGSLGG